MEILLLVLVALAIGAVVTVVMVKRQAAKIVSGGQEKPQAVAAKSVSIKSDASSKKTETSAVERKASASPEIERHTQMPGVASSSQHSETEEKIPEDSTLRRHYLRTRQAEREAITNPYPTDSALRRHFESMSAIPPVEPVAAAGSIETPTHSEKKLILPEDSTLRRHFLAQVQAEIESLLSPRPTDSTLRRHYDSQVKAKMDAYLTEIAA